MENAVQVLVVQFYICLESWTSRSYVLVMLYGVFVLFLSFFFIEGKNVSSVFLPSRHRIYCASTPCFRFEESRTSATQWDILRHAKGKLWCCCQRHLGKSCAKADKPASLRWGSGEYHIVLERAITFSKFNHWSGMILDYKKTNKTKTVKTFVFKQYYGFVVATWL